MKKLKVLNPPERIFLQVGDLECDGKDVEWKDCFEVTWCEDSQWPSDIEYRLVKRRSRKQEKGG
jgi:hypothetical protein